MTVGLDGLGKSRISYLVSGRAGGARQSPATHAGYRALKEHRTIGALAPSNEAGLTSLFKDDVLAHDRVVFLEGQPLGRVLLVLFDGVRIWALSAPELDGYAMSFACHCFLHSYGPQGNTHGEMRCQGKYVLFVHQSKQVKS